jgi:predicted TIM-barrel fold metal-dependent hydrolase
MTIVQEARWAVVPREEFRVEVEDLILVSVDDHVVEPAHLFERWAPAKYRDEAPQYVVKPDGTEVWQFLGVEMTNIGLNAVAGRPPDEYGLEPSSRADMRPGCYDIDERVKDMDANGVLGSMCFGSITGFTGQLFARPDDKDLGLALLQAYNDWHIEEWCGTHPGRFIPLATPPIWNPDWMAAEMHRVAAKGVHAVTFSENPAKLGYPSLHSDHWDPFWKACSDLEIVICLHIGSSSHLVITAPDAPIDVLMTLTPINIVQAAADLVFSPVLRKFPDLRFALSEGGIGWIPYFLERIDYTYQRHRAWTGQDFGDQLPSQVFDDRIITCFIDDWFGVESRGHLNLDHVTWECDYPHSDSTWPTSPERAMKYLGQCTDDEINKITHLNAMREFHYDPFAHVPRAEASVGALRARQAGRDVSLVSKGKPERRATNAVDLGNRAKKNEPV